MPWPSSQDYNEAIQRPQAAFLDPKLRVGLVVGSARAIPVPVLCDKGIAYEFIGDSGSKWALMCFTIDVPKLQDHCDAINKDLARANLRPSADVLAKGIRVNGQYYPLLKMEWAGFLLLTPPAPAPAKPWPTPQDYNEGIQCPQTAFGHDELRCGKAIDGPLGIPIPRAGNYAAVYEFIGGKSARKLAIKCFTRPVPADLESRYVAINKHLQRLKTHLKKTPFMIESEYLARGIRVNDDTYPIVEMQWVNGGLLNDFVRDNLHRPRALEGVSDGWIRMARWLPKARIAHGDLQHGNVIIFRDSVTYEQFMKLIDYDGMWLPSLADKPSGELGHENYQHPERKQLGSAGYCAEMDRVPLLVIACALRALKVAGKSLWQRYDNGDNLLFLKADLDKPDQSALFKELWNIPDAATHDFVGWLVMALAGRLQFAPELGKIIIDGKPSPLSERQLRQVEEVLGPGADVTRTSAGPIPDWARQTPETAAPTNGNGSNATLEPLPVAEPINPAKFRKENWLVDEPLPVAEPINPADASAGHRKRKLWLAVAIVGFVVVTGIVAAFFRTVLSLIE